MKNSYYIFTLLLVINVAFIPLTEPCVRVSYTAPVKPYLLNVAMQEDRLAVFSIIYNTKEWALNSPQNCNVSSTGQSITGK